MLFFVIVLNGELYVNLVKLEVSSFEMPKWHKRSQTGWKINLGDFSRKNVWWISLIISHASLHVRMSNSPFITPVLQVLR